MTLRSAILTLACASFSWSTATASHIAGGEITLECLGGDQYEVTLVLYRDCSGIAMPTTQAVEISSPCGTQTITVDLDAFQEVSPLCASLLANSTCNGGTLPGMEAYTYTGVVTMVPCDSWTVTWTSCCRNAAVVNLVNPGALDLYLEATLDNAIAPCASTPEFVSDPAIYVCLNQTASYSFAATGSPGDSIAYEFIPAMAAGGAPEPYAAGYTFDVPIPGITLDPLTGVVSFTPTITGSFVVVVQATTYDANGDVVSTIMRDIQVLVVVCSNASPDPFDGAITNFTGSGTQTGPYAIELCEGNFFCFLFAIADPDAGDTLTVTSNVTGILSGASFSTSGVNPVTGTVCWTAPPGSAGFHVFTITAHDNACPVTGSQTYAYTVHVIERTNAGPDAAICGAQVAPLHATGGNVFTWSVLSGDPIVVGANFSCNPCADPVADPAITTTYVVESDLGGACVASDTVTVSVAADFQLEATAGTGSFCLEEPVPLSADVIPSGPGYTYLWSPAAGLNDPTIADPLATFATPGSHLLVVNVTNADGCAHADTVIVEIQPGYVPEFTATQDDLQVPCGGSTQFHVTLEGTGPLPCLPAPAGCPPGTTEAEHLGTGLAWGNSTSYPAIYGNWYTGVRHQILYRADELNTAGITGGVLSAIGFNINNIPAGAATTYHAFEIKIGCTLLTEIPSTAWISGLTTVFPAGTVTIATGWNMNQLATPFAWDGVSNLIIEVCFDHFDAGLGYTLNAPNHFTATPYNSVHYYISDGGGVCPTTQPGAVSTERPDIRIEFCPAFDPGQVAYAWTPATGLSDPTSPDPVVTPPASPSTYTITVTDTLSGCSADTALTVTFTGTEAASFTADNTSVPVGTTVNFTNTSTAGLTDFVWSVDGVPFATTTDASYLFNAPGVYLVMLSGTEAGSCTHTYTMTIEVGTVGIADPRKNVVSIHPNPARDAIAVEANAGIEAWWVHDLAGRVVMRGGAPAGARSLVIDVRALPPGMYTVAVRTAGERHAARMAIER